MAERESKFGSLLETYREGRDLRVNELERNLENQGLAVARGYVTRIEHGYRRANPRFIYSAAKCLGLGQEEVQALLSALLADLTLDFLEEFLPITEVKGLVLHTMFGALREHYTSLAATYASNDMEEERKIFNGVIFDLSKMEQKLR